MIEPFEFVGVLVGLGIGEMEGGESERHQVVVGAQNDLLGETDRAVDLQEFSRERQQKFLQQSLE